MKQELKIIGGNPVWISALLTGAFLVVCATGGENIHWGYLGFELIFPFYLSVVVGEWCKINLILCFKVIAAQGKSLFHWIVAQILIPFWIGEHFCPCWNGLRYIPKSQYVFRGLSDNFLSRQHLFCPVCVSLSPLSQAYSIYLP